MIHMLIDRMTYVRRGSLVYGAPQGHPGYMECSDQRTSLPVLSTIKKQRRPLLLTVSARTLVTKLSRIGNLKIARIKNSPSPDSSCFGTALHSDPVTGRNRSRSYNISPSTPLFPGTIDRTAAFGLISCWSSHSLGLSQFSSFDPCLPVCRSRPPLRPRRI